jgi:hypothetical protein
LRENSESALFLTHSSLVWSTLGMRHVIRDQHDFVAGICTGAALMMAALIIPLANEHRLGAVLASLVAFTGVLIGGLVLWRSWRRGIWFDRDVVRVERLFTAQRLERSQCRCVQLKKAGFMDLRVSIELHDGRDVPCPIVLYDIDVPGASDATSSWYRGVAVTRTCRLDSLRSLTQEIPLAPDWARKFARVEGPEGVAGSGS